MTSFTSGWTRREAGSGEGAEGDSFGLWCVDSGFFTDICQCPRAPDSQVGLSSGPEAGTSTERMPDLGVVAISRRCAALAFARGATALLVYPLLP
jgi:hypothetical protein